MKVKTATPSNVIPLPTARRPEGHYIGKAWDLMAGFKNKPLARWRPMLPVRSVRVIDHFARPIMRSCGCSLSYARGVVTVALILKYDPACLRESIRDLATRA